MRGMLRLVRPEGGVEVFAAARFDRYLARTDAPQPGDIGIIETPAGIAGAIRTVRGWAWKAERGLVVLPAAHIAAWRV